MKVDIKDDPGSVRDTKSKAILFKKTPQRIREEKERQYRISLEHRLAELEKRIHILESKSCH